MLPNADRYQARRRHKLRLDRQTVAYAAIVRCFLKARSYKDAEKELRRLLRTLDTGEHVDPTKMTLGEWLETWLATVKQEVAPHSFEKYTSIVRRHLLPALGAVPILKLAPVHIRTFYNALAVDGARLDGKDGPLGPRSRRQVHRILSQALARALGDQIIARNPAEVFRRHLPTIERRDMLVLDAAQASMLLDRLRGRDLYWPVLLALATGMRRGEILALRWRNIDLDRATLRVVESLEQTIGNLRAKPPKNGRGRAIVLPAFAIDDLRRRRREQAEHLLKLGARLDGATRVCDRADGEPFKPLGLTQAFLAFMRKQPDLPRVRFHDLRHTHATALLAAGAHPKVVQERLGHSSVALTLDLYSHTAPSMQDDAAAKIDMAFGGRR